MAGTDAEALYREVVELLQDWHPNFGTEPARERAAAYLERNLADRGQGDLDVATNRGLQTFDVVVDGTVAVNTYRHFRPGDRSNFVKTIHDTRLDVEYLVVYAHDLPPDDTDTWHVTQSRTTADSLNLKDVTFVFQGDYGKQKRSLASVLSRYAEVLLFGLLGVVVAVGLLVGQQQDGRSIVGGIAATTLTALVLLVVLFVLWETTDV